MFDTEHESLLLNQIAVVVEKKVDDAITNKTWDVGGRVEWIWGGDSRFIHALGLFDYDGFQHGPRNQFDLNQAYVDIAVPVGNGLKVRLGKFVTPIGQEYIDPTANALYSHSYLFNYAIPFTHTGAVATYVLNDQWTINGGVTRGWDTSLKDNNDTVDGLFWVNYTHPDKVTTAQVAFISGPDQAGDNSHWRSLVDLTVATKIGDKISLAFNADYGYEVSSVARADRKDSQWFGGAVYMGYTLCDYATVNVRAEYFNDHDGVRLSAVGPEVYELTAGVAITPFPASDLGKNLVFRPEVRWDVANKAFFDGGTDRYQITAAIDAIYKF